MHVAGRTFTVSLYSPTFLRATFTFPKPYPHVSPTIDLERNLAIPLKTRAFLLASLRKLMAKRAEKGLGSLELALKFLAGEKGEEGGMRDEDEDEEGERDGSRDEGRSTCIVPPPARGGAVFGPQGEPRFSPHSRSPIDDVRCRSTRRLLPYELLHRLEHPGSNGDIDDGRNSIETETPTSFRSVRQYECRRD